RWRAVSPRLALSTLTSSAPAPSRRGASASPPVHQPPDMALTLVALLVGLALIAGALWDAFETVVLPRRVERRLRIAGAFYRDTWKAYSAFAARFADDGRREEYLSYYHPPYLLLLAGFW